jgi:hypothetical protein
MCCVPPQIGVEYWCQWLSVAVGYLDLPSPIQDFLLLQKEKRKTTCEFAIPQGRGSRRRKPTCARTNEWVSKRADR